MLKKIFKFILYSILVIFILLNCIIIFSGRWYLYKAIATTYLQGKSGPSATEYQIFENRKIEALNPKPWPVSKDYNTGNLSAHLENVFKEVDTHALVIIKNDTLIHEQYWDNFSDTSHTNSFSMAKSYIGALLGFAIQDGYIKNINEPVSKYIPEFANDWRSKITLEHLVTMSSGIAFDESYANPFSYPAEGYYGSDLLKASTRYTKMQNEPGKIYKYLSGNTALLGYCISKAIHKPLSTYLSEKLWGPINCEQDAYWSLDTKDGLEKSFCCINSNAKDFARMGKLYMHFGNWNGNQLLDSNYVRCSISAFNCNEENCKPNHTYGYAWWLTKYKDLTVFYMQGMLGQFVICVPEKKLIISKLSRKRRVNKGNNHYPIDVAYCIDAALTMYERK
ncbi:MAG: serine hydrolase [Bacteroidia bacterium]|nr:serine hydrolase [Bacteroidia bacterium]